MRRSILQICVSCLIAGGVAAQNDGTIDTSFVIGSGANGGPFELIRVVEVDELSRILLGGSFASFNGTSSAGIIRLVSSGTNDVTFQSGVGFAQAGGTPIVYAVLRPTEGSILVGGLFTSFNGTPVTNLVMLTDSGAMNTNFSAQLDPSDSVLTLANQPGRGILVGGAKLKFASTLLKRLTLTGSVDPSFQPPSGTGSVFTVTVQSDGSILIGGVIEAVAGTPVNGLARLTMDGVLDSSFHLVLASPKSPNAVVHAIALVGQKVVIGGAFNGNFGPIAPLLRRLNADGSEESSLDEGAFTWDTEIRSIVVLPDLRIVAAGARNVDAVTGNPVTRALVMRFRTDGQVDTSFPALNLEQTDLPAASSIKLQVDGRLIVGGDFYNADSLPYVGACRLHNSAPPVILNPRVNVGYLQFDVMTLPGASYALEELVELGGTWQPTAFFVGTGTMEAHQIMLERTSGFLRIKQTL